MTKFTSGQEILIPAEVVDGPFPAERLVSFETSRGPVSGFVAEAVVVKREGKDYLRARIQEVTSDTLLVWVNGSFSIPTVWRDCQSKRDLPHEL